MEQDKPSLVYFRRIRGDERLKQFMNDRMFPQSPLFSNHELEKIKEAMKNRPTAKTNQKRKSDMGQSNSFSKVSRESLDVSNGSSVAKKSIDKEEMNEGEKDSGLNSAEKSIHRSRRSSLDSQIKKFVDQEVEKSISEEKNSALNQTYPRTVLETTQKPRSSEINKNNETKEERKEITGNDNEVHQGLMSQTLTSVKEQFTEKKPILESTRISFVKTEQDPDLSTSFPQTKNETMVTKPDLSAVEEGARAFSFYSRQSEQSVLKKEVEENSATVNESEVKQESVTVLKENKTLNVKNESGDSIKECPQWIQDLPADLKECLLYSSSSDDDSDESVEYVDEAISCNRISCQADWKKMTTHHSQEDSSSIQLIRERFFPPQTEEKSEDIILPKITLEEGEEYGLPDIKSLPKDNLKRFEKLCRYAHILNLNMKRRNSQAQDT